MLTGLAGSTADLSPLLRQLGEAERAALVFGWTDRVVRRYLATSLDFAGFGELSASLSRLQPVVDRDTAGRAQAAMRSVARSLSSSAFEELPEEAVDAAYYAEVALADLLFVEDAARLAEKMSIVVQRAGTAVGADEVALQRNEILDRLPV